MDKYYYFVSELPTLFFENRCDITIEWFLDEAQKWLIARDYQVLSRVNLMDTVTDKKEPQLLRLYKKLESHLINEVAAWRKSSLNGKEEKPFGVLLSLIQEGNPLEIEIKLLKHRWDFIEEMSTEHHFDLEFLIQYYLKLQILAKLALFDKERGVEVFHRMSQVTV
jgi:hypothetical protein